MQKFQNKYRIQSSRMPGWDYARGGKYYVTIVTKNRICCFGNIINGEMQLNELGKTVNDFWLQIPAHFEHTYLDEHVVMPNHIHGIVVMKRPNILNGTNTREQHRQPSPAHPPSPACRDAINRVSTCQPGGISYQPGGITGNHNPMLSNDALGKIIRWHKSRCTFEFNQLGFQWYGWQPRFYDEIIRNDERLQQCRNYIRNNPAK